MASTNLKQFIQFGKQLLPIARNHTYENAIEHYSTTYPELTNAVREGQEIKENKIIHKVKTAIGQKG